MSRSKHTEAQMIAAVKQMEAGRKAEDVAREVGVSAHTIYAWRDDLVRQRSTSSATGTSTYFNESKGHPQKPANCILESSDILA
jgi:transposase-like protein